MKRFAFSHVLLAGALACSAAIAPASAPAADPNIKIGVIGPLTGGASTYGIAQQNGIQVAVDEANAKGGVLGRKIEIVSRDDQGGNPSVATTAALELVQSEKVSAVFGPIVNTAALAVAKMSDQLKVPIMGTLGATTPVVYPNGAGSAPFPWVFRVLVSSPVQVEALVKYGTAKGYKKWAIVYENDAYGLPTIDDLQSALGRSGGTLAVKQAIAINATDATAQALAIKAANPDVILIWCIQAPASKVVQALSQAGVKTPLLSANAQVSPQFYQLAGDLANGIISTALKAQFATTGPVKTFRDEYTQRFKIEPSLWAYASYDAAKIYLESVAKAKTADPDAVRKQLETTNHAGLTGKILFSPKVHEGITEADVTLVRINNAQAIQL